MNHPLEHLVAKALSQAGVLPNDQDAGELRAAALQIVRDSPGLMHIEALINLTDALMAKRYRGLLKPDNPAPNLARQLEDRDQGARALALAYQVQLNAFERDVLYLGAVVGMSTGQITEALEIQDDRVAVTWAKLQRIYGHF